MRGTLCVCLGGGGGEENPSEWRTAALTCGGVQRHSAVFSGNQR